ncbi:MAG: hypothetical protein WAL83_04635 [Arenicellales bacterium]
MKRFLIAALCFLSSIVVVAPAIADRNYSGQHGYRMRPYDHRSYDHESFRGHQYTYRGHWRSWDDWHHYRGLHPRVYERGHYFRQNGHLMFRFCDPGSSCFFFSIGR